MNNEHKRIKAELHHWWPQCVSKHWLNKDSVINQLFFDEKVVKQTNTKRIGAIRNAHLIKIGTEPSGWDQSFESFFDNADNNFPEILDIVSNLSMNEANSSLGLRSRFLKQDFPSDKNLIFIECLLSLIVRSPRFRNYIELTIGDYKRRGGLENYKVDKTLININSESILLFVHH